MQWTKQRKMMISGGLTVLSFVLALLARRPSCWLAALAMAVSSIGDGLLAGHPKCFAAIQNKLTKGGIVFLAAHILYIIALVLASGQRPETLLPHFWGPFAVFAALTVLHSALYFLPKHDRPPLAFFAAAFCYLLTVGTHGAAAFCAATQAEGNFLLNAIGAALFFLSDASLLARKYGVIGGENVTDFIWLTYIPAQLCLLLGFYFA
ncbi:MAG: hypothetical protein IJQ33_08590 [Clostridia bacterium]|nr:hypothetical protein [Clostridia bacterium]